VNIPRGDVGAGAVAPILVLHPHPASRRGRGDRVASLSDLNLGLFVGREDVLIAAERLAVPDAMVEIQDAGGLRCEVRISGKDPAPSGPRAESILG
jgi:hypothetical protein